jgi:hypothetical protein
VPAVLACALVLLTGLSGVAGASTLHVIPFPGTPDASPHSQIIFSSLRPADLRRVWVEGRRSGGHAGHLIALPAGAGVAFVPDQPFAPGELVRVRAALTSTAAGAVSGDPGSSALSFSFTTAVPAGGGQGPALAGAIPGPPVPRAPLPSATAPGGRTQSFRSEPRLTPPAVSVSTDPDPAAGDLFLTPAGRPQGGAMILDPRGKLVWFAPVRLPARAFNLQLQHYMTRPVLTWWEGTSHDGHGAGVDVVLDTSYRLVATVRAGNGYGTDLHEFQITPQGTALLDSYVPVRTDLSSVGGSTDAPVYDCVVQEIDIATGQVLWEWHSLGHIPLSESHSELPRSGIFQYLHLNSVRQLADGNLLISGRNTWAVYLINRQTGDVIWTLGGRRSSFTMGPGTNFEWQHDAQMSGNTVTVFDDGSSPEEEHQSEAKVLTLDTQAWTATLAQSFNHSPALLAASQGSAQELPDGNLFVGWGSQPYFSEYSPAGQQVFDGHFPLGVTSYRAYRFPWTAQPLTRPALAVVRRSGGMTVYASWNGATQVARWCVLGGRPGAWLAPLACAGRTGFETAIRLGRATSQVAVQARDASGHVLGTSKIRTVSAGS